MKQVLICGSASIVPNDLKLELTKVKSIHISFYDHEITTILNIKATTFWGGKSRDHLLSIWRHYE